MTREEAIKTLKENSCAMCAYASHDMDSCDILGCDNRDAIKVLERESCEVKTDNKCQECEKDWTKCTTCPVMMKWVKERG